MAKLKTETLVRMMKDNPEAVREFLNCTSHMWEEWFPDHIIKVKMKTVKNLMSGNMVEIPANTPYYLDPSSETYWSR